MRLIASTQNWIEGAAVQQLEKMAALPGMELAVGLPDLHPGKGSPVGAAFLSQGIVYPYLVGSDIGCGIALYRTDLPTPVKRDAWAKKLKHLEGEWDGDAAAWLRDQNAEACGCEASLGTIGSGNHFAEIQRFERVENPVALAALGLDADQVCLLVHSGSRGFGEQILRAHTDRHGAGGLAVESDEGEQYRQRHDQAMQWARANRALIAHRFLERLQVEGSCVLDICHNSVTLSRDGEWLHRKGAAPADQGPVVIPGSRGSFSYLVTPRAATRESGYSLAHGAGRKWARSDSRGRLEKRFTAESLTRTELGSVVICEDRELLYEEAPQAYKNVDVVVQDLVEAGLVEVIAVLRPVITYKVRR